LSKVFGFSSLIKEGGELRGNSDSWITSLTLIWILS